MGAPFPNPPSRGVTGIWVRGWDPFLTPNCKWELEGLPRIKNKRMTTIHRLVITLQRFTSKRGDTNADAESKQTPSTILRGDRSMQCPHYPDEGGDVGPIRALSPEQGVRGPRCLPAAVSDYLLKQKSKSKIL